jgi:hypothetical protein
LPILLRYSSTVILGHAQRVAVFLLRGRLPVLISARLSAFPYLFKFWKKRRETQRNRKVSLAYLASILERRRAVWR